MHRSQHATSHEDGTIVGNFKLLKTIGKGNFAKVKLARHLPTGREVRIALSYSTFYKNYFMLAVKFHYTM